MMTMRLSAMKGSVSAAAMSASASGSVRSVRFSSSSPAGSSFVHSWRTACCLMYSSVPSIR